MTSLQLTREHDRGMKYDEFSYSRPQGAYVANDSITFLTQATKHHRQRFCGLLVMKNSPVRPIQSFHPPSTRPSETLCNKESGPFSITTAPRQRGLGQDGTEIDRSAKGMGNWAGIQRVRLCTCAGIVLMKTLHPEDVRERGRSVSVSSRTTWWY